MTQLLVSVRDGVEALAALRGGAALIDVKEPRHGPLGRPTHGQLLDVARAVQQRAALSTALGELNDHGDCQPNHCLPFDIPGDFAFAKLGLAGAAEDAGWTAGWKAICRRLPAWVSPVGVIYADWQASQAPRPAQVLRHAARLGCRGVLVDTWTKSGCDLFTFISRDELFRLVDRIRHMNMFCVVAGSLNLKTLPIVLPSRPDFIAVRGAVCCGGRTGSVDESLVGQLAASIAGNMRQCTRG